jgi:hypothetical protein
LVQNASSQQYLHDDFSAREASQNLPAAPSLPQSPSKETPTIETLAPSAPTPTGLEQVSIDGTWSIKGVGTWIYYFHIVGYANGDLNITRDDSLYKGNWTITGHRQGERILITASSTVDGGLKDREEHYDLKLVSPTSLIGSVEFRHATGWKGLDTKPEPTGWKTGKIVVNGVKSE